MFIYIIYALALAFYATPSSLLAFTYYHVLTQPEVDLAQGP